MLHLALYSLYVKHGDRQMPDLAGKKTAYFGYTGIIDSNGVTRIAAAMNHAANNAFDEIYLCFSSLGGYVGDGVYLYNHIKALPLTGC